ncbi:MAG TPA: hypothetical protein VMI54_24510 [Polyangiaceae bacterium]|nr:hypothetical protein [Polyangiaceae bacterium]
MRTTIWALGLACAWAAACGGNSEFDTPAPGGAGESSGGSGATSGSGGIALDALPDAYAKAYCDVVARCFGAYYGIVTAYEDCETITAERLRQSGLDALSAAVDAGTVDYHADKVQACLDATEAKACSDLTERGSDACEAAITGTRAAGESCELDEECVGSLICDVKDACPGTCVERYSAGLPCGSDDQCADGLVCSQVNAHCVKPAESGEACGGGVEAQCDAGLLCQGDDKSKMMPGQCVTVDSVTLGNEGDACDPSSIALCATGLSCVLTAVSPALGWQCQKPGDAGATCGLGLPEDCPVGQYCPVTTADVVAMTLTAKCTPLPAAGEACAARPFDSLEDCVPYARCDTDGKCVNLRNLGESCDTDDVCYTDRCVGGACEPVGACD